MRPAYFMATAVHSSTEEIMHAIHECVGWSVLTLAGAVLVLGGARTYLLHQKSEIELSSMIESNSVLSAMHQLNSLLGPIYRRLIVVGAIGLCSNIYRSFEVGVVDRLNYAVANGMRKLSDLIYSYVDTAGIDELNYFVARVTRRFSDLLLDYAELAGIDRFNYVMPDGAIGFCSRFRKTHTGMLSYNMILVGVAFVMFLMLSLYMSGILG